MTWERTLYAPMKDLNRPTVLGSGYMTRVLRRCGLAEREPAFQIQPRIVVVLRLMMVLWADKRKLHLCMACRTLFQLWKSSWGELPPQYRSSAILATDPSCSKWAKNAAHNLFEGSFRTSHPHIRTNIDSYP